ncbi:FitA-like ribbon-helix-helix domain-containing protein [Paramicrobacterium fandaimingii]|uniref:FitA-like ribbon-helix-helix domain-containing protein n=1 Tax=Paramicrobacterium fandaimingii TaxID=2708079 RepID=UPI00141EF504|nr:Arc family DNA-binding protein [Microbacterium fandaimingii]
MAAISVRDLDDDVKAKLRARAAANGRSMEAEIRLILSDSVSDAAQPVGLLDFLLEGAQRIGGVNLTLPPRSDRPRSPDFSE